MREGLSAPIPLPHLMPNSSEVHALAHLSMSFWHRMHELDQAAISLQLLPQFTSPGLSVC